MIKISVLALACVISVGCAYNAPVTVAPAYDVYSNYENKVPGNFALYIDSSELETVAKVQGYNCSFHSYPADATSQFSRSVHATLENLAERVELVDSPLTSESLLNRGYDAQIIVEALDYDIRLRVIPGFWNSEMEADVEIAARMKVDGFKGRQLGTTVEGDGDALVGAGAACEGGAEAIGLATSDAIRETMERLGERITNARTLREDST